jgi:hypothetical protein
MFILESGANIFDRPERYEEVSGITLNIGGGEV